MRPPQFRRFRFVSRSGDRMPIKLSLASGDLLNTAVDVAVAGIPEGASATAGVVAQLEKTLGAVVPRNLKRDEFTGKKDQTADFPTNGAVKPSRVVLMGLGKGPLTDADVRLLAAKAARFALGARASSLAVEIPAGIAGAERAAAEGILLGRYRFTRYLTGDRVPKVALEHVTLLATGRITRDARAKVALGQRIGEAICTARDLVNEPANELYPEVLARAATSVCEANHLHITVLNKAAIAKKGMKLLYAVGQGSAREPRFVH